MKINFILNGEDVSITAHAQEKALHVLQKECGIASLYSDCTRGNCGKCIVLFNGHPSNSCLIPAFKLRDSEVITLEGIKQTNNYSTITESLHEHHTSFCMYCESSRVILLSYLLDIPIRPESHTIDTILSSVYCHCMSQHIVKELAYTALDKKEGRINRYANR